MTEQTLIDHLGLMVCVPATGNCFAIYSSEPSLSERKQLLCETNVFSRWPAALLQRMFDECIPSRTIVEYGPTMGAFLGSNIHEWITTQDKQRYQFDHVIDLKQGFEGIGPGEIVLSPGIAYRPILACKE